MELKSCTVSALVKWLIVCLLSAVVAYRGDGSACKPSASSRHQPWAALADATFKPLAYHAPPSTYDEHPTKVSRETTEPANWWRFEGAAWPAVEAGKTRAPADDEWAAEEGTIRAASRRDGSVRNVRRCTGGRLAAVLGEEIWVLRLALHLPPPSSFLLRLEA